MLTSTDMPDLGPIVDAKPGTACNAQAWRGAAADGAADVPARVIGR